MLGNRHCTISVCENHYYLQILDTDFVADQCPPLKGFQAFSNVVPPNFNFSVSADSLSDTSSPTTPPGFFSLSVGYVKQCIISASFDYLKMLDTYRYNNKYSQLSLIVLWHYFGGA